MSSEVMEGVESSTISPNLSYRGRPALPAICLNSSTLIGAWPPCSASYLTRELRTTLRAGRFTPAARVGVLVRILISLSLNPSRLSFCALNQDPHGGKQLLSQPLRQAFLKHQSPRLSSRSSAQALLALNFHQRKDTLEQLRRLFRPWPLLSFWSRRRLVIARSL